jgi:formylglycine-generating enzyme required for sulfatase activity
VVPHEPELAARDTSTMPTGALHDAWSESTMTAGPAFCEERLTPLPPTTEKAVASSDDDADDELHVDDAPFGGPVASQPDMAPPEPEPAPAEEAEVFAELADVESPRGGEHQDEEDEGATEDVVSVDRLRELVRRDQHDRDHHDRKVVAAPKPKPAAPPPPATQAAPSAQSTPSPIAEPFAAAAPSPAAKRAPETKDAGANRHRSLLSSKPAKPSPLDQPPTASVSPGAGSRPVVPVAKPSAEPIVATTPPFDAPAAKPMVLAGPVPSPAPAAPGGRAEGGAPSPRPWASSVEVVAPPIDLDIGDVCIEPITKIRFLLLKAGRFMMGSEEGEPDAFDDERPLHRANLNAFWLAETPVTNAQYAEYVKADGAAREPRYWRDRGLSGRDQPVVAVSWYEARMFCEWLSRESGWIITLPSEAQWEYAARGGLEGRRHPWGNEPPDETRACFGLSTSTGRTAPVGQYPRGRGPFGHLDLAGNVWEWCRDTGDPAAYARADVWSRQDPIIDDPGAELRVCRGGGWYDPAPALRAARRTLCPGVGSSVAQGFRVCRLLSVR